MDTTEAAAGLARVFAELIDGTSGADGGFVLNTGDAGLIASLGKLTAADASRSANGGTTLGAMPPEINPIV